MRKINLTTVIFAIAPAYFGLFMDIFFAALLMIIGLVILAIVTAAASDEDEYRPMLRTAWITFILSAYVLVAVKSII